MQWKLVSNYLYVKVYETQSLARYLTIPYFKWYSAEHQTNDKFSHVVGSSQIIKEISLVSGHNMVDSAYYYYFLT